MASGCENLSIFCLIHFKRYYYLKSIMSLAPQSNQFEFTNDFPQQVATRPSRPIRRLPRFWRTYLLGFAALSIVVATVGRFVWLAHLDRTYRQPVVGRLAYDGPSRNGEQNAFDAIFTMMTGGFWGLITMPQFYERPGWSLEMRTDGTIYEHGKRLGDWSARGKQNEWVLVQVWERWRGYKVWKFRSGPAGKLTWTLVEGGNPIPLRSIP